MKKRVLRYLRDKILPPYHPTKLGKAIIDSMVENPDDWMVDKFTAKHLPSTIEVWAANDIKERQIYKAPDGINTDAVNNTLSYGDRVAIEEIIQRLRKRCPETGIDQLVDLLAKKTEPAESKP
jgi:hypothetical protein